MMYDGAINWCPWKQTVVATSTSEAEYISLSSAGKEGFWHRHLLFPLVNSCKSRITILLDSNRAMRLAGKNAVNRYNKHIDMTQHFVRDAVARNYRILQYNATSK